jgi:hypothetical protein
VARGETLQLSGNEQALVLGLVNPVSDGHFDRRRLGALLAAVEKDFIVVGWGDSARYVLGVQLGTKALADAVGGETNWLIQSDDRHGQLEFIRADLALGPEIVRNASGEVWVLGESLAYRLVPGGSPERQWGAAVTRSARKRDGLPYDRTEPELLPTSMVEIIGQAEVASRLAVLGSRAGDWSKLLDGGCAPTPSDDIRLGMLLTEVALVLYGAAEALPIEIVERGTDGVWAMPAEDEKLDALRTLRGRGGPRAPNRCNPTSSAGAGP